MKGKLLMILAGAALLAGCGAAVSAAAPQPTEQPAAEVKAPAPAWKVSSALDRKSVRVGKECRSRWSPYH